jgi:hypothetical protein
VDPSFHVVKLHMLKVSDEGGLCVLMKPRMKPQKDDLGFDGRARDLSIESDPPKGHAAIVIDLDGVIKVRFMLAICRRKGARGKGLFTALAEETLDSSSIVLSLKGADAFDPDLSTMWTIANIHGASIAEKSSGNLTTCART